MVPMQVQFVSMYYFHSHFHLTPTVEVKEMYDKFEKIDPKIAKADHYTIITQL